MQFVEKIFPEIPSADANKESLFSLKRVGSFLIALTQLAVLFFIVKKLNIEKASGISEISLFIILSFIITSFTTLRFRPFVFFVTGIGLIYYAFGFFSGSLLIAGAVTLLAVCHLPIKLLYRVAIVLLVFASMAILRADLFYAPRAALVVPFLASMFMFRIVLYLFELKYSSVQATIWQRLNYFFLFPNTCFLFFPIVDYKTYIKTYYNVADTEVWQKGIRWVLRGVTHIIGYRIIYHYACISVDEVSDLPSLLQYMFASYALILRLSGLFHFIIGLLCMFGFNLHPAFNNYFLATSFTDLWRRINIYWREFMLKIFFYPFLFKIKKRITTYAIPVATICVFVITWFLHNYQLFWLRGYFQLVSTDIVFWLVLGSCITINVIINERALAKPSRVINVYRRYFYSMLKMIGMFLFMAVMWSLWTSGSLSEWLFLLSKGSRFSLTQLMYIIFVFTGVLLIGVLIQIILNKQKIKRLINLESHQTVFLTVPCILLLILVSCKTETQFLPQNMQAAISVLSEDKFNETDKKSAEAGYYKKVIDGEDNAALGLWEINLKHGKKHSDIDNIIIRTNGLITRTLKPNFKVKMEDHFVETNSFGLRDKEYTLEKPFGTFRIVLLGGSYEMGAGVSNNQVFEGITEQKLNKYDTTNGYMKYEIINFALYRYHLIQHVELCNTKVFKFSPDAVVYVAHSEEERRFILIFTDLIRNGVNLKYPFLEHIKSVSGAKQSMSETEIEERLKPFAYSLIMWSYMQIENACYKNKAEAIWAYLPTTDDIVDNAEYKKLEKLAKLIGFITIDLRGVYGNNKATDIQISKTNTHPNPFGHQLIAQKLYNELIKNRKQIFKSSR